MDQEVEVKRTSKISSIDCEQSLSFFRFSKESAHARERRAASGEVARREKRGRQPEKKKE